MAEMRNFDQQIDRKRKYENVKVKIKIRKTAVWDHLE